MSDSTVVGLALRERRIELGISLREAARRAGWSAPYVSDLERGRREFGFHQIKKYTEAIERGMDE